MAAKNLEDVVGSIREGAADAGTKLEEAVHEVAGKIEEALDEARFEGRYLGRRVKEELTQRWKKVDRVGRENAFYMAAGALALGVLVGYLISRDRD